MNRNFPTYSNLVDAKNHKALFRGKEPETKVNETRYKEYHELIHTLRSLLNQQAKLSEQGRIFFKNS